MTAAVRHRTYPAKLTDKHLRIWRQLVIGGSNKEITQRMGLRPSTIKHQLEELYTILGTNPEGSNYVRSRTLATLWGFEIIRQHPEVFRDVG